MPASPGSHRIPGPPCRQMMRWTLASPMPVPYKFTVTGLALLCTSLTSSVQRALNSELRSVFIFHGTIWAEQVKLTGSIHGAWRPPTASNLQSRGNEEVEPYCISENNDLDLIS